jgi:two-component system sensor histidine kinase/response regulator
MVLLKAITRRFNDISIRSKLRLIIMSVSLVGVMIAAIFLVIADMRNARGTVAAQLNMGYALVVQNMTEALQENNVAKAKATMDIFKGNINIIEAYVLTRNQKVFAQYRRDGEQNISAEEILTTQKNTLFGIAYVDLFKEIVVNQQSIGFLYIRSDLHNLQASINRYMTMMALILLITALLSYVLASFFEKLISSPLVRLSAAIKHISDTQKYYLRVEKTTKDEVGDLVEGFNALLMQIGVQTEKLSESNQTQEKLIEKLSVSQRQTESAHLAKTQFLARMSHEIRTPINGVLGMVDLLLNSNLTAQQVRLAKIVRSSGMTLLQIINDLLDFSKMEAAKLIVQNKEYSLREMAEDVTEILGQTAFGKNVEIGAYVDPRIPPILFGDPFRLRQVLVNLLGNAVKFTAKGEVALVITLQERDAFGVTLKFEVIDSGIGINEAAQEKIFEAFSQADAQTASRYGGTGLGLTISKQIVELMDGTLTVKSKEGVGSTFSFTINQLLKGQQPSIAAPDVFKDWRCLVADSAKIGGHALQAKLQDLRLQCTLADKGYTALEQLRQMHAVGKPYNVLFLASRLLDQDCLEFLKTLQSDPLLNNTAVVVMSPSNEFGMLEESINTQWIPIIGKPVRVKNIIEALQEITTHEFTGQELLSGNQRIAESVEPHLNMPVKANGKAYTVLIAEDNPVNAEVTRSMVVAAGYIADVFPDGQKAVHAFKSKNYDLVLMDGQMPEMDGLEATKAIREYEETKRAHLPPTPIIAATANIVEGICEEYIAGGMSDFIIKPFTRTQLLNVMQKWLSMEKVDETAQRTVVAPVMAKNTTSQDSHSTIEIIDTKVLQQIFDLQPESGQEFLNSLLALYIKDTENSLEQMQQALEQKDTSTVQKIAHKVKSSSANVGALKLARFAQAIESLPDCHDIVEKMNYLQKEYESARSELEYIMQIGLA